MKFALLLALVACGRLHFGDTASDARSGDGMLGDGSGSVAPFQPSWTSGTRFRARLWTVGDGGDPIYAGWRDTQTDTDCINSIATDGVERCMPNHTRADQYYADAGCTQPLAWIETSPCGHDTYAYVRDASSHYHAFPIGASYSGPVYTPGPCTPASAPAGGQLYATGAEAAPTLFASTRYHTATVGNYVHLFSGYSDGSSLDLDELSFNAGSCKPTGGMASGTTRCMPTSDPVLVPAYGDAGCTQRIYYSAAGDVPSPEFRVDDTALCGVAYTLYDVVADVTAAQYWTLGPTGCAMQPNTTGKMYTATPNDPWPTGTIAPSPRRGRLGKLYWTTNDGVSIRLADWDEDLQRSCYPFIAQDGVFRCLPKQAKLVTACPDATCTGSSATIAGNCYGLDPVDGPSYPSCDDGPWTMHTIAPVTTTTYDDEATCTSLGAAYDNSVHTGTLPPAMFAPLVEVIE